MIRTNEWSGVTKDRKVESTVHVCRTMWWVRDGERRVWGVQPSVCPEVTHLVTLALPPLTLTYVIELVDGHSRGQAKSPNEHLCCMGPRDDHQAGIG